MAWGIPIGLGRGFSQAYCIFKPVCLSVLTIRDKLRRKTNRLIDHTLLHYHVTSVTFVLISCPIRIDDY